MRLRTVIYTYSKIPLNHTLDRLDLFTNQNQVKTLRLSHTLDKSDFRLVGLLIVNVPSAKILRFIKNT